MNASSNRAYRLVLYIALILIVAGAGILLLTTDRVGSAPELWPLAAFLAGVLYCLASMSVVKKGRTLFPGILVSLAAIIRFCAGLARLPLGEYWPIYVIAAGVSVGLSGLIGYRRLRPAYVVPALAFVLLGTFFLVFSFGFSSMSFKTFISRWWPGLVMVAGIILFALYFLMRAIGPNAGKGGSRA